MISKVFLCLLNFVFIEGLMEGDQCSKDGLQGTCRDLSLCKSALENIKKRKFPEICDYRDLNSIVCCFDDEQGPGEQSALTSGNDIDPVGTCIDIPPSLTSKKTGQKAFDKCIEYQNKYVYPCERTVALIEGFDRNNHCFHSAVRLILGGTDAAQYEFPHMVMLGFGDNLDKLHWSCSGSIISERFILTAGHCLIIRRSDNIGDGIHALVGTTKLSDVKDKSKLYKIIEGIPHPDLKKPNRYNDIALCKTEIDISLNRYVVPACIHIGDDVNDEQVTALGWGNTAYSGEMSDTLQKVKLTKFETEECIKLHQASRLLRQGFDNKTQLCYGDKILPKDTCQGDAGGPVQIESAKIHCMYTIVGITSLGRQCGIIGDAAVYTRVAHYVSWIESVVWPN